MNPDQLLAHFDRISEAPDAIARLRNFILDLAIRGKLIEQDRNDEPATSLLTMVDSERLRLIKAGTLKKQDLLKKISDEELPFTLPKNWALARMGWLAVKLGAGSTPLGGKSVYLTEGIPFLRSQNVYNDGLRLDDVAFISKQTHEKMAGTHVCENDLLLNITGASIGRCAIVPKTFEAGNVSQHVAIIRLVIPAIREFIHLSIISPLFQKLIDDVQVGVSREGLSMQRLRQFPMPLPPLAEQKQIVAKVDELMGLCDRLEAAQAERERRRERLTAASLERLNKPSDAPEYREHARFHLQHFPRFTTRPDQIPQLRRTILNLAVLGKLATSKINDESPGLLLEKMKAKRQTLIDAKKIRKPKVLLPISDEELPATIPTSWLWTRWGDICDWITYGFTRPMSHVEKGPAIVTAKNVQDGFLTFETSHRAEASEFANLNPKDLPKRGDILITKDGTIGRAALVETDESFCINQSVAVLWLESCLLYRQFLLLVIRSPFAQIPIWKAAEGMAIKHLSITDFGQMLLPVPPLAEQKRIVARVNELMALCDQLEASLTTTQNESTRLLEALLHDALKPAL